MTKIINKSHNKPRIFISYARSDGEDFARKLRRRLIKEYHLSVWQDRTDMEGGKDWWKQIEDALRSKHVEYLVLVMTPNALQSDMVRMEWRLARNLGICVEPVIASQGLDFKNMSTWMRAVHFVDPNVLEQWERFILTLKSPCRIQRVPFMADALQNFVERPGEFDQLISNLLEKKREEPVAIKAALRGAGGYGKTTLARALCHDERIQEAFYDGILWVTLGKEPGDLIDKVNDLIEILSGERPGFKSIESAANHLVELIAYKQMLIVIDDVWNGEHLKHFLQSGQNCTILITTRNMDTLPDNAKMVNVDAMQQNESVKLLGIGLPPGNPAALQKLASRLGNWPLLLKLVNSTLHHRVHTTKQPLADALVYVINRLDTRGITFFDVNDAIARDQAVKITIGISFELLKEKELARYFELAIFPEDVKIPINTLEKLWGMTGKFDTSDTEDLCDRLFKLSLLQNFDLTTRHIHLHDVMQQYLIHENGNKLPALHSLFLDTYRSLISAQNQQSITTDWPLLPPDEQYLWRNIAYHMVGAERKEELCKLFLNFDWLKAKLEATDVNSLISDYYFLPPDKTLHLVQGAILISAHILAKEKSQLKSQLYGRLMEQEEPEIKNLMKQIKQNPGPWLCPLHQSLINPGGPLIRTLEGHTDAVNAVAVSPDGKEAISASNDHTLKIWDIETGLIIKTLQGHTDSVVALAVSPDGKKVISASIDQTLKIWDIETGKVIHILQGHAFWFNTVAFSPDGKKVISASGDHTLKIWDIETGLIIKTLQGHTDSIKGLAVTLDGRKVISASMHTVKIWDIEKGSVINTLQGHTDPINAVAVSPDGKRVISASGDHTLKIWNLETGKVIDTLYGHTGIIFTVAISPDGKRVISASWDHTLKIWDIETGTVIDTLQGHTGPINAVAVSPDGRKVISASVDRTLKIWNLEMERVISTLQEHTDRVNAVAVSPDGKRVISASGDHTLKIWDIETGTVINSLQGHTRAINAVAVSLNGKKVISASGDHTLKIWDIETGRVIHTLQGHTGAIFAAAVSTDGKSVISASGDHTLKIWDIETGRVINTLQGHTSAVNELVVTPDGKKVISASYDYTLKIWDIEKGLVINTLRGHTGEILAAAISPDGRKVISASGDHTLKIWDIETGSVINTLHGHTSYVNAVVFSPDGKRVISASGDHTLKIWDFEKGSVINTLQGHTYTVNAVVFSPDGKRVISASGDHTLKIWDFEKGRVIADFHSDIPLLCCKFSSENVIIAGDSFGKVHFLRLEGLDEVTNLKQAEQK